MRDASYPVRTCLFHAVCTDPTPEELLPDYLLTTSFDDQLAQDERFFRRLPVLNFEGRSVLDYGCGIGCTCLTVAARGARRVLGVDIQPVDLAQIQLETRYPGLQEAVEFRQIQGAEDIGDERFDVVISKNTFEHVADPLHYVRNMTGLLAPDGQLVIGFSPLWKSPYGGHLDFMTKLPWAHLLFPEVVILRERKRFRPEEDPNCFEEVRGGLNRMTLAKFRAVMNQADLTSAYFEINRNDRMIAKVLNMFSQVPGLREYFTFSVHGIWKHVDAAPMPR